MNVSITAGDSCLCRLPSGGLRLLLIWLLAAVAGTMPVVAQQYQVQVYALEDGKPVISGPAVPPENPVDAATAFSFVQSVVPALQQQGYLAASVDSIYIGEGKYEVWLFTGMHYKWAAISLDGIPEQVLLQTAIQKTRLSGKALRPEHLASLSGKLLDWSEQNGYPFATVWLDDIEIRTDGGVRGTLRMDQGVLQKIDTVIIHGEVSVSRNYLLRYLELKQGMPYNEKKLRQLSQRLHDIPFLQEAAPWTMMFGVGGNKLHLYLKEKKANQLDALIGLLPNNMETGKLMLTADVQLAFQNILAQGESISASYQNLQYRSPRFKTEVVYPYIPGLPVGLDFRFDLFKKDTAFRRTMFQAGIRYQLGGSDYIRVFFQQQSNRLITTDTAWIRANKRLPEDADIQASGGGVEWVLQKTDYRLNPRKGWEAAFSMAGLVRKIRKNDVVTGMSDVSGFRFDSLYDTLVQRRHQLRVTGSLSGYLPLYQELVLRTAYNGGWISGKHLFRNELFQIGGFRLLRGFDEQSIFVSQYHVLTAELRLLIGRNAHVYLFSDNAYIESAFHDTWHADMYNGFGAGTSMETRSGIFTLSYALGRNSANPVQFRQSKIHFGYVAYF